MVTYQGQGCPCTSSHTYEVHQPQPTQNQQSTQQYTYDVVVPPQPQPEVRYQYDYELQVPNTKTEADYLQGLYTQVDRIAEQQPDCKNAACSCQNAPHLCPVHANGAQAPSCSCQYAPAMSCPLHQLDSNEANVDVQRFDITRPAFNVRNKRGLKETLEGLKAKRQTNFSELNDRLNDKILELSSKREELINKIKQKRSQRPRFDFTEFADKADQRRQSFLNGVKANFEGLQRDRRDAMATEQKQVRNNDDDDVLCPTIESLKRSGRLSQNPDVLQFMPEVQAKAVDGVDSDGGEDVTRTRKHCHECGAMVNEEPCVRCHSQGGKSYHPSQSQYYEYVDGQPVSYVPGVSHHHIAMEHADDQAYVAATPQHYVYDRYGHRYVESNGNLRLVTPDVSQHVVDEDVGAPNMAALNRILAHNQKFIADTNNHEPGRMTGQTVDNLRDSIDFIHEILHNPNPIRPTTHSDDDEDDVGAMHEYRLKKDVNRQMYQVVPMMTDDKDGSLIVKIYPTQKRQQRENKKSDDDGLRHDKENEIVDEYQQQSQSEMIHEPLAHNVNSGNNYVPQTQTLSETTDENRSNRPAASPKATAETNGKKKKYEILTIDGSFEDVNDEVDHILRFIYDTNVRHEIENNVNAPKRKMTETENAKIFHWNNLVILVARSLTLSLSLYL